MVRSISSSASNYRAACRAKSKADFIYKLKIVEEELDESMFWLELVNNLNEYLALEINTLHTEANELLSITIASIHTARKKLNTEVTT